MDTTESEDQQADRELFQTAQVARPTTGTLAARNRRGDLPPIAGGHDGVCDRLAFASRLGLERTSDAITATIHDGAITARRVIVCAGAWTKPLLQTLGIDAPLDVARQTMHWLDQHGDPGVRSADRFPVALIEHDVDRLFYTMPDTGDGVKVAIHHEGAIVSTDSVDRSIHPSDTAPVQTLAERFIPGAGGRIRESAVCLYTNTPDRDFIIDAVAEMPNVVVVSACSGHGFKFASAIGEIAAQLCLGEACNVDLSPFRADRFHA